MAALAGGQRWGTSHRYEYPRRGRRHAQRRRLVVVGEQVGAPPERLRALVKRSPSRSVYGAGSKRRAARSGAEDRSPVEALSKPALALVEAESKREMRRSGSQLLFQSLSRRCGTGACGAASAALQVRSEAPGSDRSCPIDCESSRSSIRAHRRSLRTCVECEEVSLVKDSRTGSVGRAAEVVATPRRHRALTTPWTTSLEAQAERVEGRWRARKSTSAPRGHLGHQGFRVEARHSSSWKALRRLRQTCRDSRAIAGGNTGGHVPGKIEEFGHSARRPKHPG